MLTCSAAPAAILILITGLAGCRTVTLQDDLDGGMAGTGGVGGVINDGGPGGAGGLGGSGGVGGDVGDGGAGGHGGSGGSGGAGGESGTSTETKAITVACADSVVGLFSLMGWEITVEPEPIQSGRAFTASIGGVAVFPVDFLDAAQSAIAGGVKEVNLVDIQATVHVRAGATGPDVVLTNAPLPYECLVGKTRCDPANDLPSIPGNRGNTDCQPEGDFNVCARFVTVPTSSDCDEGGVCEALLKTGPGSQCEANKFCVTGELTLPLETKLATYTASTAGRVRFGWDDAGTGATIQVGGPNDGTWILPAAVYVAPTGPNGLRVGAASLSVALECTMGVDSQGPDGVGSFDFLSSPTPNSALLSFPIMQPSL